MIVILELIILVLLMLFIFYLGLMYRVALVEDWKLMAALFSVMACLAMGVIVFAANGLAKDHGERCYKQAQIDYANGIVKVEKVEHPDQTVTWEWKETDDD